METGTCNASEVASGELESAGCLCARAESSLLLPPATGTSQELSFVVNLSDFGMSEKSLRIWNSSIFPHQDCH